VIGSPRPTPGLSVRFVWYWLALCLAVLSVAYVWVVL